MTTQRFNITALSPTLVYDPPQDVTNSVWTSDEGGIVNGNADSGDPGRVLSGTGTVTVSAFGTGVGFAGSISGVYCTYKAMLSAGDNNNTPPSSIPGPQTASPSTGMLASYTGLPIGNWQLQLKGICGSGSKVKITDAVVDGWVGEQGGQVTSRKLDSADSELQYSGVDWSIQEGLSAPFYDDKQQYTSSSRATMNFTFSGSAIIVWSSVDNQHGPYAASLHYASSDYDDRNTLYSTGYNPFLAVPIPFFFVTGLDPTQSYTLVFQNKGTNGTYLDVDYVEVYTSTGGGPPNGGTSAVHAIDSPSNNGSEVPIIAGAVGGGVGLLLLLGLIWFFWRRRQTKIDGIGGTRPMKTERSSSASPHSPHIIPLQTPGSTLPVPFHSSTGHLPSISTERQGLLQYGANAGYNSPPHHMGGFSSSSSGYDPYASFGGGYPSPPTSSNIGPPSVISGARDPVQARRIGKAAELDAARERAAMRVQNGSTILSPLTPHPNTPFSPTAQSNLARGFTPPQQAHSVVTQSWEMSSNTPSTHGPASQSNTEDIKLPDEPPPSYDNS